MLEKIKEVQRKVQQNDTHLAELKAETEAVLKQIQKDEYYIDTLKKWLKSQQAQTENAALEVTTRTEQKMQKLPTDMVAKSSTLNTDQNEEADKPEKGCQDDWRKQKQQ